MEKQTELTNCPQCENACPKDQLKCGRGRAFFGVEKSEDETPDHKNREHHHSYEHNGDHAHHGHGGHHHHEKENA